MYDVFTGVSCIHRIMMVIIQDGDNNNDGGALPASPCT